MFELSLNFYIRLVEWHSRPFLLWNSVSMNIITALFISTVNKDMKIRKNNLAFFIYIFSTLEHFFRLKNIFSFHSLATQCSIQRNKLLDLGEVQMMMCDGQFSVAKIWRPLSLCNLSSHAKYSLKNIALCLAHVSFWRVGHCFLIVC